MKIISQSISSFKVGEASSFVNCFSRVCDYSESSRKIQNLTVTPQGYLIRRAGSLFIKELEYNSQNKLLVFKDGENHVLIELFSQGSDSFFRFYLNGKVILRENEEYKIVATGYSAEHFTEINYVFDYFNKRCFLFHSKLKPKVLTWDSDYKFSFTDLKFFDGPYNDINTSSTKVSLSAKYGSGVSIYSTASLFKASDVGKYLRAEHNEVWGVALITAFVNDKQVKADIKVSFYDTAETKDFRLSQWDDVFGYPSFGLILNDRLYLGHNEYLWASKLNNYLQFSPTTRVTQDDILIDIVGYDDAISMKTMGSSKLKWLQNSRDLLFFGGEDGVYQLKPMKEDEAISPYNYMMAKISSIATSNLALGYDGAIFFLMSNNIDTIGVFTLNDQIYIKEVNRANKHFFQQGASDIYLLKSPFNVLVFLTGKGTLACMGGYLDSKIETPWFEYVLGGKEAFIQSISVVNMDDKSLLYLSILRKNEEDVKQTIEIIEFKENKFLHNILEKLPIYLDSYVIKSPSTQGVDGLDIFNHNQVAVFDPENEIYFGEYQVENGNIFKEFTSQSIYCGYNFPSIYKTQDFVTQDNFTDDKKVTDIYLGLNQSKNLTVIASSSSFKMEEVANNSWLDNSYLNSIFHIKLNLNWEKTPSLSIIQNSPLGMNLFYLKINMNIN